jgi:hypothetical protein
MYPQYPYYIVVQERRNSYGFWKFCGDIFMIFLTWGLWLIWIFVREMRKSRCPY